jgi:hypothetical protein
VVLRGGEVVVVVEGWALLLAGRPSLLVRRKARRLVEVEAREPAAILRVVRVVDVGLGRVVVALLTVVGTFFTFALGAPGRDADPKYLVVERGRVVVGWVEVGWAVVGWGPVVGSGL